MRAETVVPSLRREVVAESRSGESRDRAFGGVERAEEAGGERRGDEEALGALVYATEIMSTRDELWNCAIVQVHDNKSISCGRGHVVGALATPGTPRRPRRNVNIPPSRNTSAHPYRARL